MAKLHWDGVGEKIYEVGVDQGVLYVLNNDGTYADGVAWNGLSAVNENPSGAEATKVYADNGVYANVTSAEDYSATIEAFTCPRAFYQCDGMGALATGIYAGQQTRKKFGFSFRTKIGNDAAGEDFGYKIHLIYGATAKPSTSDHGTINESPDISPLSWEISTEPVEVPNMKKTAHIVIDSTEVTAENLAALEAELYGTENAAPKFPSPARVLEIVTAG